MTSEQHQFTAQGRTFPVILVRKKVKNINLHVRSDGTLYLSAPARVPWAYIEDFLEKKTDFIIRAICEMEERKQKFPILTLKGIVTMNTYLAIMPEAIIDHVMLHELCHFLQPNHSRHFYDAMTIRMPDWKARRQAMAKYLPYCV